MVPVANQLIGKCDRRADVLFGYSIFISNTLRTVPGSKATQNGSNQNAGACDDRLAMAAIGIHFDTVCDDIGHNFASMANYIPNQPLHATQVKPESQPSELSQRPSAACTTTTTPET